MLHVLPEGMKAVWRGLSRSAPLLLRAAWEFVVGRPPRIVDDRGCTFEAHRVSIHFITGSDNTGILAGEDMSELRGVTRRGQPMFRTFVGLCMMASPLWLARGSVSFFFGLPVYNLMLSVILFYCGWRTILGHLIRVEDMLAMLRKRHRCLACAHTLDRLPAEPDGCCSCPECAAAWKVQEAAG